MRIKIIGASSFHFPKYMEDLKNYDYSETDKTIEIKDLESLIELAEKINDIIICTGHNSFSRVRSYPYLLIYDDYIE